MDRGGKRWAAWVYRPEWTLGLSLGFRLVYLQFRPTLQLFCLSLICFGFLGLPQLPLGEGAVEVWIVADLSPSLE